MDKNTEAIQMILEEIARLGIKKKVVAYKSRCHPVHLSYVLNGRRPLTEDLRLRVFKVLGL
jgi:plasmid maintenance system antidote protein VapI